MGDRWPQRLDRGVEGREAWRPGGQLNDAGARFADGFERVRGRLGRDDVLAALAAAVRTGRITSGSWWLPRFDGSSGTTGRSTRSSSTRDDDALADAAALDERVASGEDPGLLAGLPLLVKDNEEWRGCPRPTARCCIRTPSRRT